MKRISVAEAPDALDDDTVLLDVREPYEWAMGHAPHATHAPLSRIDQHPLDRATTYITVCRSGNRSSQLAVAMERAGFTVLDVDGGMQAWAAAGRPMTTETGSVPAVA